MKRFYLFSLLFFVSLTVLAKNKISMVTYFPVPYVAYSQVNTTEQMDIGLTSACSMKLGCSEESATLNAAQVNLKGGKLNLDGGLGIKGYTLSLGSGNGEGKISFQNVRIQTGNMESVNAADIKAANLNLFGKAFPSCKAANSESGGQMQWASLKLKGASSNELYLMCGESAVPETPKCTADRRTKWDGTRCVCPNDGEYWVNGFCCSVDTPKTNRQCWIPPRTAWLVPAGFDHTSVSGNANCNVSGLTICPGVQMQYNNDPNNTYWVLPSNSDIADGKTCSPTRQCIYDCVIRRKSEIVGWSYTADIKIAACAERAYTPQWDPAVHKNY